jgi:hypothetical protein
MNCFAVTGPKNDAPASEGTIRVQRSGPDGKSPSDQNSKHHPDATNSVAVTPMMYRVDLAPR